jgi:protein PhnA
VKRGTKISSIRLTDNADEVDCLHDKIKGLVLRVEFLKKA